jgi:DNA-directed RNA polymerase II subunit RPB7
LSEQKELTHTILLHPSYFGPRMLQFLESKLYSDVEGTCSGQFGYIIAVVSILDIGKGMVLSGSGQAEFITRYRAIVFKPFKGEVVDGVVNNVNKVRPQCIGFEVCLTSIRGARWVSLRKLDL